jgi:hypothetical protein
LNDTISYYGVTRRARLPHNQFLGFDPDYQSVDASEIARGFLDRFSSAIESQKVESVLQLVHQDGFWKDVELVRRLLRLEDGSLMEPAS